MHNHLSLFLCVADYDKLLPGWSHFAQFTIAVVNKDPKKSKYSDTLHRFCKKEHDWGWKKFMELSKVLDGFTVADTLVIKARVQVIHERPAVPVPGAPVPARARTTCTSRTSRASAGAFWRRNAKLCYARARMRSGGRGHARVSVVRGGRGAVAPGDERADGAS